MFALGASLALAQDAPADNMDILRDKIRADKKLVVAANMGLTESEATSFWPVYEAYQQELESINYRMAGLIESYAADYRENALTDAKAAVLIDEMFAIEQAEVDMHKSFVPRLSAALPARKVARYLQIERKLRAIVAYEVAAGVPLVE
jgi:hypothetical protein